MPYRTPSILVVDDDPSVRSLLATLLKIEGYAVRAVEDGFTALRSVEDARPDCVVLDVMMPGMDGHQVLRALRSRTDGSRVPVVMLTAVPAENVWRAWREGVDYVLRKPFAPDDLLRFLRYLFADSDGVALRPA
jgi:DNA-binding response OmpR family regulator